MNRKYKIIISILFSAFFLLAFAPPLNPTAGGWTQQFMPDLGGKQIKDIVFLDSLLGIAVAHNYPSDSNYVLKTNNGGDNWQIIFRQWYPMQHIQFLDANTGYACAGYVYKTTNGGFTWNNVNTSGISAVNMFILNEDTIWLVNDESFNGGVFRTINGGMNWQQQFSGGNQNPDEIYMYNARLGFISNSSASPNIYKTSNSGENWTVNVSGENFTDMYFADSLTGWKCMPGYYAGDSCVKKTTNGGLNWIKQRLPQGGMINLSQIYKFSGINGDTIWGSGGSVYYSPGGYRGILFRTTNGGGNWLFQIPDTNIHIVIYGPIQFINKNTGWAYSSTTGIHTTNGGNDTFYTGIEQINSKIPNQFKLYQNFPNPFNPRTVISYELGITSYVTLSFYNILGKHIIDLVNQKQNHGSYQVDFSGNRLSSGVYFYSLIVDSQTIDTKKMILIK